MTFRLKIREKTVKDINNTDAQKKINLTFPEKYLVSFI